MPHRPNRPRYVHPPEEPGVSKTDQLAKDHTDVNAIVARYTATGRLDHLAPVEPRYGDFTGATDLSQAMTLVRNAEQQFSQFPAKVRSLCGNNPAELLRLMATEEGIRDLQAAGLPISFPQSQSPEGDPAEGGPSRPFPSVTPERPERSTPVTDPAPTEEAGGQPPVPSGDSR